MSERRILPAGQVVVVSSGAYSDYAIMGVYQATRKIDVGAELESYLADRPGQKKRHRFSEHKFLSLLESSGALVPCEPDWLEWHLPEYSSVDEVTLTKWRNG